MIFCPEIFHEIFLKYFKNFTIFFRLYTHSFNIFICQTLPFIHLCILQLPTPICRPILAWFACLSTGSELGLSSDYYDVRRTRYSPVAVTEVKVSVEKSNQLTSFHTINIEIFCRMKDYAGCIMYSSLQQSKPVKGNCYA